MRKIITGIFDAHQNRIFGLDLLRAFAIFCTVYGHAVLLVPEKYRSYHNLVVSAIDGVSIFFVLSGYLIGGILLKIICNKEEPFKISIFWMRRWMRTLPAYFFILIILIAIYAYKGELDEQFYYYLWFGQNLFHLKSNFFAESWSLAIEEWFYLLFPVCISIILFLGIKLKESIKITIILFFIIPFIFKSIRYFNNVGFDDWDANYRRLVFMRFDTLAFGMLAAYIKFYYIEFWKKMKPKGIILGVFLLCILFLCPKLLSHKLTYDIWVRNLLEGITVFLLLPYFSELKTIKSLKISRVITLLSIISYSMYLLNETLLIKIILTPFFSSPEFNGLGKFGWILLYASYWIVLIPTSILMYRFVEYPFINMRARVEIWMVKRNAENN